MAEPYVHLRIIAVHRIVQLLFLIRQLIAATLAAPAGREKQVLEALPEALEKPFYRQNTFTVIC